MRRLAYSGLVCLVAALIALFASSVTHNGAAAESATGAETSLASARSGAEALATPTQVVADQLPVKAENGDPVRQAALDYMRCMLSNGATATGEPLSFVLSPTTAADAACSTQKSAMGGASASSAHADWQNAHQAEFDAFAACMDKLAPGSMSGDGSDDAGGIAASCAARTHVPLLPLPSKQAG